MEKNKIDTNEIYKGITRVIKTKKQDKDVWFAVIGKTIVSRGTFDTKEECIKDLEKLIMNRFVRLLLLSLQLLRIMNQKK